MSYNLTQLGEVTTIQGLVSVTNSATGNILTGMLMLSVFFILLLMIKSSDFVSRLLVASLISFVLSSLLAYASLMNIIFPIVFLILTAFSGMYLAMNRSSE